MDFPSYVPQSVREHIGALLEGDRGITGWLTSLQSADAELLRAEQRFAGAHPDAADEWRREVAHARSHRDHLADEVACIHRLAHDARMQSAYARLAGMVGVTDAMLRGFVYAAWAARIDYGKERARLAEARELARDVEKAAGALAELLARAEDRALGMYLPSELFDLRSLLEKTEHEYGDRDFCMWPGMRRVILGEPEFGVADESLPHLDQSTPLHIEVRFVDHGEATPIDPVTQARNTLRYAWGTAPRMRRLIQQMQQAAAECDPVAPNPLSAAAIASARPSTLREYLRAFAYLLRSVHRIDINDTSIRSAMATTATVVLDDPNIVVSADDVRKALA